METLCRKSEEWDMAMGLSRTRVFAMSACAQSIDEIERMSYEDYVGKNLACAQAKPPLLELSAPVPIPAGKGAQTITRSHIWHEYPLCSPEQLHSARTMWVPQANSCARETPPAASVRLPNTPAPALRNARAPSHHSSFLPRPHNPSFILVFNCICAQGERYVWAVDLLESTMAIVACHQEQSAAATRAHPVHPHGSPATTQIMERLDASSSMRNDMSTCTFAPQAGVHQHREDLAACERYWAVKLLCGSPSVSLPTMERARHTVESTVLHKSLSPPSCPYTDATAKCSTDSIVREAHSPMGPECVS